jgi:aminopeptidase YwaD
MNQFLIILFILLSCGSEINPEIKSENNYLELVGQVNIDSLMYNIDILQGFESRAINKPGHNLAHVFLKNKLISYEYSVEVDTFTVNGITCHNIIASKNGLNKNNSYCIVGAHYDSRNANDNVIAPGADDNASGVAVLLEMARLFKSKTHQETIKFILFDAEEDGLKGSTYFSNRAKIRNDNISFMFNMDMVGGYPNVQNKITCEEDRNNSPNTNNAASVILNSRLVSAVNTYSNVEPIKDLAFASDYDPFQTNGFVIVGLYDYKGIDNPLYHTKNDSAKYIQKNYLTSSCKAAIGFIAKEISINL